MQRRVFLLFLLFVVLAAFYANLARQNVPAITAKQQAQTEMFNQMDERVLSQAESTTISSSN